MFDDPKKELQRLQEQLLAADGKKESESAPRVPQKKPVAERYVHPAASKEKKSAKPKEKKSSKPKEKKSPKPKKNHRKDETGGLWAALVLELAVLAGIVMWWNIWK